MPLVEADDQQKATEHCETLTNLEQIFVNSTQQSPTQVTLEAHKCIDSRFMVIVRHHQPSFSLFIALDQSIYTNLASSASRA